MTTLTPDADRTRGVRPGSGAMFDGIAHRYDLLNRLLSLGLDQSWRRVAIRALELGPGARVLDLATGTADMALLAARMAPGATILGTDPSTKMLERGREKVHEEGREASIELVEGSAEQIDAADASFDGVMIAFGIRNVPDRERALAEMARVVKPTGRVSILELTEPRRGLFAPFARLWTREAVPAIGALISGASEYRYLQRSIEAFPTQERFAAMMMAVGLEPLRVRTLGLGACSLFVARRSS